MEHISYSNMKLNLMKAQTHSQIYASFLKLQMVTIV